MNQDSTDGNELDNYRKLLEEQQKEEYCDCDKRCPKCGKKKRKHLDYYWRDQLT